MMKQNRTVSWLKKRKWFKLEKKENRWAYTSVTWKNQGKSPRVLSDQKKAEELARVFKKEDEALNL